MDDLSFNYVVRFRNLPTILKLYKYSISYKKTIEFIYEIHN